MGSCLPRVNNKDKTITIRLTSDDIEFVDKLARMLDSNRSEVIRLMIKFFKLFSRKDPKIIMSTFEVILREGS